MSKLFKNNMRRTNKVTINSFVETAKGVQMDVAMLELKNNNITKENFLKLKEVVLPETVLPYAVMALNYDCNSKVGSWTNLAMAICTALPTEFFHEDGTPNKERLTRAFKTMTLNGTVEHYESIFMAQVNIAEFFLKEYGMYKVVAYYVSNKEVKLFKERLQNLNLNTLTVEDVKAIQADLWFLFRAWQESSIDMTKDKSKQFILGMEEILGRIDVRTNVKFEDIMVNDYMIVKSKYADEETERPAYTIDFGVYDDENGENDGIDFIETTISSFQHKLRCRLEEEMQEIANAYMITNNSRYAVYNKFAAANADLALTIQNCMHIIKDASYNKMNKLDNSDFMIMRAVIYQEAQDLGIEDEMVVKVALGVAGGYAGINRAGQAYVSKFDEKAFSRNIKHVEKLFGNLLVLERGELYGSELVSGNCIRVEVEAVNVYEDVENGVYKLEAGEALDKDGNVLFDINNNNTGEVEVTDEGVYYLYNVYTELDNMPEIDVVISDKLLAEETIEERGTEAFEMLTANSSYTLVGNELQMEDEEGLFTVMTVEDAYALPEDEEPVTVEINKWYGNAGIAVIGEEVRKRFNKFMILSYDPVAMKNYLQEIKHFCK